MDTNLFIAMCNLFRHLGSQAAILSYLNWIDDETTAGRIVITEYEMAIIEKAVIDAKTRLDK